MIKNSYKFVINALQGMSDKVFLSLKKEGFSETFSIWLIRLTMVLSIAFGVFAIILAAIRCFNIRIPLIHEFFTSLINFISQVLHFSLNSEVRTMILAVAMLVILNLPIILLVGFQKLKTRNLIKKYRDKERGQSLIKP